MDRMRSLQVLVNVVEAGSFVAAADRLKMSTAAVTRHVAALEQHLGVRLLHRTTRSLSLTGDGEAYLARVTPLLEELDNAERDIRGHGASPRGTLRINAPVSFGMRHLAPALAAVRRQAPDLQLDIDLNDRVVDLAEEGYDVALRIGRLPSSALVARRLATIRLILCAAPAYLERHGTPTEPAQLRDHRCLMYSYLSHRNRWTFERDGQTQQVPVNGHVTANNGDLISTLAQAGEGIALQPHFIVHRALRDGRLVHVMPQWSPPATELHAVYLHRRHLSAKVRVLVDCLAGFWANGLPWDDKPGDHANAYRIDASPQ